MLLLDANTDPRLLALQAGGKASHLARLERLGLPVPAWHCLPAEAMEESLRHAGRFEEFRDQVDRFALETPQQVSADLCAILADTPLSPQCEALIEDALPALGPGPWAVRSSGLNEDSPRHSFAGVHDSFLNVTRGRLHECVRRCWMSAFSERALAYRKERRLSFTTTGPAVVLQAMVDAACAGVLFTCDPVSGSSDTWTLQAVKGLGEAYVSGQDEGQGWTLAPDGRILSNPESPLMGELQVKMLHGLSLGASAVSRDPVDIEWAMDRKGDFFLLQVRPVTSGVRRTRGILNVWDNSNIVESYGGLTSPLSFSFARGLYHRVYVRFCREMGVGARELSELEPGLRNMLGLLRGRVHYNLLNWYRLTGILPGYRFNRAFMESMMGVPAQLESDIAERIRPPEFSLGWRASLRKIRTGLRFWVRDLTIDRDVKRFLDGFHRDYDKALDLPFASMDASDALAHYDRIEAQMLDRWDVPIVNDFLCMVHHGFFRNLCKRWLGEEAESLGNDLLASDGHLESAAPMVSLQAIACLFHEDAEAVRLVLETPDLLCREILGRHGKTVLLSHVDGWIRAYGFRCMDEMKLEARDLHLEPERFFQLLRNLLKHPAAPPGDGDSLRTKAQGQARRILTWWQRPVFAWSLSKARQSVRNRENTRFCRTRIYGIARLLLRAVARDFVALGWIECEDDLFWLELSEIRSALEGTLTSHDLQGLVELRKQSYAQWDDDAPPSRFLTRGPVLGATLEDLMPSPAADRSGPEGNLVLVGKGCGPGIVEGIARVVTGPSDDLSLNGEILIASRTDPGWIPLYPAISGLAVERGGLLSHSAVVAREMGLPTVVGVGGLLQTVRTGMRVRLDGTRGTLEILADGPVQGSEGCGQTGHR
ncbi:MAG: hypothetical protein RL318_2264 [Fibrobacterota bacterium]|jgi:pyruvate,water dikinase